MNVTRDIEGASHGEERFEATTPWQRQATSSADSEPSGVMPFEATGVKRISKVEGGMFVEARALGGQTAHLDMEAKGGPDARMLAQRERERAEEARRAESHANDERKTRERELAEARRLAEANRFRQEQEEARRAEEMARVEKQQRKTKAGAELRHAARAGFGRSDDQ
mgnify:CR=1 FL=1